MCGTQWILEPGDQFTMDDSGKSYEVSCPVCGNLNECFEAFSGVCRRIYRKGESPVDRPRREVRLNCSTCGDDYVGRRTPKAGDAHFCPSCKKDRDREAKRVWAAQSRANLKGATQ